MLAKQDTESRTSRTCLTKAAAVLMLACTALFTGCDLPAALTGDVVLNFNSIDYGPDTACPTGARLISPDDPAARTLNSACAVGAVKALARS